LAEIPPSRIDDGKYAVFFTAFNRIGGGYEPRGFLPPLRPGRPDLLWQASCFLFGEAETMRHKLPFWSFPQS
jgi:hypothetical protein